MVWSAALAGTPLRRVEYVIGGCCVMDTDAFDAADVPLLFAVQYLIREYRNCIATLQSMLDENRDLFVPLPNDHPVALGVPLPHSLLAPHRLFCDAVRAAIATIDVKPEGCYRAAATLTDVRDEPGNCFFGFNIHRW